MGTQLCLADLALGSAIPCAIQKRIEQILFLLLCPKIYACEDPCSRPTPCGISPLNVSQMILDVHKTLTQPNYSF